MESVNRWQVGDVRITRVIELESVFPTEVMLAGATQSRIQLLTWLHPHYADAQGMLRYSVHAYLVESQGRKIVVGTCVGNDKPRAGDWNNLP